MALNINGTTGISGVDGSASAPALQGTDTNTGINFASDTVNINTGGVTRATVDSSGNLNIPNDSGKIQLGTGNDLEVFHNGTNSHLRNQTGDFIIDSNSSGSVKLRPKIGEEGVVANTDGSVELYHDGSKKCSTITTGIEVHGTTDSARIEFNDAYSNSRIGYFGLNRFGIDGHDGLEVRDPSDSFATRLIIDSSGRVGIGTATTNNPDVGDGGLQIRPNHTNGAPDVHFTRASSSNTSSVVGFVNGNVGVGSISYTNSGTSFNTSSDYRLKENITTIADGITRVKQLIPKRFNFIDDETNTLRDGFIAHEVTPVVPEAITGEKDAVDSNDKPIYQGIDQAKLVPLLTAALQEAVAKIEVLETKVAALEAA